MQFLKTGFFVCFVLSTLFIYGQAQGEYHQSDPLGNFKVSYAASDGHFLVEDRTYDGTAHLGNYGYSARDGESVGVAYGTDGAGFVIRGPGAGGGSGSRSSYPSSVPSYPRAAVAPAPRRSAYRPAPATYNDGAYYERYQDSSSGGQWPASGRTQTSSASSAITSYSSLPANTPAPASYVSAAASPSYHTPSVYTAPSTSNYIDPYATHHAFPTYRQPFSYAFESYSYQPPPPPIIATQPSVTYSPTPAAAVTYAPQPSAYSYNRYASPTNIMQYAFNSQHPTGYSLFRQ